ncbi:MAG: hypothetical protein E7359_00725 [Clostridiales bacterium]|nr:hypothetical protein [Clostridiales bacterium]
MENKTCKICNSLVVEDFEFCPYCGAPITKKAQQLENTKTVNSQLVLLASLIRNIEDTKSLYVIDKFIKKLSKTK